MLHYDVKPDRSLNDFIHLNDVRMSHNFKYVNFASYTFNIINFCDLVFFEDLNCDFLLGKEMDTLLDFAKCTLTQCFSNAVASNNFIVLLFGAWF